ncbi:MAG: hypothetical protein OXC07_00935 [Kistimonas sp.]|nr:hypothetical protein [Kistimonas sp.]
MVNLFWFRLPKTAFDVKASSAGCCASTWCADCGADALFFWNSRREVIWTGLLLELSERDGSSPLFFLVLAEGGMAGALFFLRSLEERVDARSSADARLQESGGRVSLVFP